MFGADLAYALASLVRECPEAAPWALLPSLFDFSAAAAALVVSRPGAFLKSDGDLRDAAAALDAAGGAGPSSGPGPKSGLDAALRLADAAVNGYGGGGGGGGSSGSGGGGPARGLPRGRRAPPSWEPRDGVEARGPLLGLVEVRITSSRHIGS